MKILSIPITLFLILFPFFIFAANPLEVVINEVAWMGTKIDTVESKNWWRYEWLELYNNTNQLISLDGWQIELYRTGLDWILNLKGTIPAQGYFLIVASDKIFPNYNLDYSNLGGKFINSGQKILLKNGQGEIIDEVNCASGWFAGDNETKQTMERKNPQLSGSDSSNWQTSQNPSGTPKTQNSIIVQTPLENDSLTGQVEPQPQAQSTQQPIIYPTGVVINEILPSPEGPDEEEEWIEIFNRNDFEVDLAGWQIQDVAGKTKTYTFPKEAKIAPQGFLVLPRPESKITLNNDGDGLNLVNPEGKIIDSIFYTEKAPKNKSFNRIENDWVWSSILTPGLSNQIPAPEIKEEPSKELVKENNSPLSPSSDFKEISLATVSRNFPKEGISFFSFLTAFSLATLSAVIIFVLKRRVEKSKKID